MMLKLGGLYEISCQTWVAWNDVKEEALKEGSVIVVLEYKAPKIMDSSYSNIKVLAANGKVGWICEHRKTYNQWKLINQENMENL